ncbi:hypothetical protein [Streptomyces chrestomyceticus]|uniref:hypothetical protein n=1 Tax=Streptomyces chrestomyceticus TaxID=68185 RepID=UPI0037884C63
MATACAAVLTSVAACGAVDKAVDKAVDEQIGQDVEKEMKKYEETAYQVTYEVTGGEVTCSVTYQGRQLTKRTAKGAFETAQCVAMSPLK